MRQKFLLLIECLILIECFFQIISYSMYVYNEQKEKISVENVYKNHWYLGKKENKWWLEESPFLYAEYHPFLSWMYSPLSTNHIHLLEDGVRLTVGNPEYEDQKTKSVFVFGGSTVAGSYVADNETIPSFITQKINTLSPGAYKVINYGQFGYNSTQEIIKLLLLLKEGQRPDYVIFYDGCNDLFTGASGFGSLHTFYQVHLKNKLGNIRVDAMPDYSGNLSLFNKDVLKKIAIFSSQYIKIIHYPLRIIQKIFHLPQAEQGYMFSEPDPRDEDPQSYAKRVVDNYVKNFSLLRSLSQQYGFTYISAMQPLIFNKELSPEEKSFYKPAYDSYKKIYSIVSSSLGTNNLYNYYDLTHEFEKVSKTPLFIEDACHITPYGNSIIADTLVKILLQQSSSR